PIGLCETTCLEYTTRNSCLPFFAEVNKALNETGETGDLDAYTDCSANHSFLKGANESTNTCYQVLTGIETHPESTTGVVTTAYEVSVTQNDVTREGDNMRNIALAYVLPSVCAAVGTSIVVLLVLSGCYIRRLRKRSRCMGVTLAGDSYSHTNAFPQLLGVREIYSNRYTVPHCASEDDSREVERSILPVTASTTATSSGASNTTENSAVFQLDLADWAAVGEGVLIPFERVTITGHLGEGAFGYVVKGLLKDVHVNGREYHMPVAMKTLKNCASYAEMRGLLVESSLMHSFSHPHILSLRGLCLNPKSGAPYLVMPFMENGDLRKFLRKKADLTDGGASITSYPHVCLSC
ncbi:Hepatocyte growth factor receptor, partial [Geodia barretti]